MMQALCKKRNQLGNKGFSLVELIIVIAIMAVLIAILAPQFLKYVEKSRVAADDTTAATITTAINVMLSDPDYAGTAAFTVTWAQSTDTVTVSSTDADTLSAVETDLGATLDKTFSAAHTFTQNVQASAHEGQVYTWAVTYPSGVPTLAVTPWTTPAA